MAETGQGKRAVPAAQGVQVADHPWFSTMRATLASSVGDADETLAALKMAERQLHQECDSLFIDPFGYAKLQGYAGRAYVRLRLYKAAEPALREALVGVGATKYRGVLLCDLARVVSSEEAMELQREARELGQRFQSRKVLKAAAA
jgi:hypothetical protein